MSVTGEPESETKELRGRFKDQLDSISPTEDISYYDFLFVARKLELRFQESSHLMALKSYFVKNGNMATKQNLIQMLAINTKVPRSKFPNKTIIKFIVPEQGFDSIRQVTDEEEGSLNFDHDTLVRKRKIKSVNKRFNTLQHDDKIALVVNLKVKNTLKKIESVIRAVREGRFFVDDNQVKQNYTYESFKKRVNKVTEGENLEDDDLKSLFFLLDGNRDGVLTRKKISQFVRPEFQTVLTEFYKTRVNPEVFRSSEFRRGASINSLQMYKAKNPWTIELSDIEQSILSYSKLPDESKKYSKPRFGPLRHYNLQKPHQSQKIMPGKSTSKTNSVLLQKSKIQKLLRQSKPFQRKSTNPNETITSKLRKLFVEKVILPREKMFEEYRSRSRRGASRSFDVKVRNEESH